VPRKQLKVYFFLPYARSVPVKVGLELVCRQPSIDGLTSGSHIRERCRVRSERGLRARAGVGARSRRRAGLPAFLWRVHEVRLSSVLFTLQSKVDGTLDTQLNAAPTLPVLARTVSGCLNSAFSRHFYTFYEPSVQSIDTQLNALPILTVSLGPFSAV